MKRKFLARWKKFSLIYNSYCNFDYKRFWLIYDCPFLLVDKFKFDTKCSQFNNFKMLFYDTFQRKLFRKTFSLYSFHEFRYLGVSSYVLPDLYIAFNVQGAQRGLDLKENAQHSILCNSFFTKIYTVNEFKNVLGPRKPASVLKISTATWSFTRSKCVIFTHIF